MRPTLQCVSAQELESFRCHPPSDLARDPERARAQKTRDFLNNRRFALAGRWRRIGVHEGLRKDLFGEPAIPISHGSFLQIQDGDRILSLSNPSESIRF